MPAFAHHFGADNQIAGNDFAELADLAIRAAFGDLIKHFLAADHSAECGCISVELGRCDQGDEEHHRIPPGVDSG